jgi:NAD(P)-dependent dehydrogenase (short-subunit alcohol dehydrogenase family)
VSVYLVTGCRSGFGRLTALEAAKRGHVVYAGLRDLATAGPLLTGTEGLSLHPVQLDVTDAEQRAEAVARIVREQGRIDVLVNNAGRVLGGFLEQVEEDEIRGLLDVNVVAVWALTKAVLPTMRAQGSGSIVMVSSMSGRMALPGLGTYATTKFALEGMSEALRHELAPFGISVVIVEPGPYATDIWDRNLARCRNAADESSVWAPLNARVEAVAKERAIAVAGDPADVARRICDLAEQRHPGFRHPMGPWTRLRSWLAGTAPFWVVEWAVGRTLRLKDALRT